MTTNEGAAQPGAADVSRRRDPLAHAYRVLGRMQAVWSPVDLDSLDASWLDGHALCQPSAGKLQLLLARLGRELGTSERKIIASAFVLRFGVAASATLGPFLVSDYVPALRLDDIALKFDGHVLLERVALRLGRYRAPWGATTASTDSRLGRVAMLRESLSAQAEPVLRALCCWSRLQLAAAWGLVTSAWCHELAEIGTALDLRDRTLTDITLFLSSNQPAFRRRPHFHLVDGHIRHVRGSCCLNYRIPGNEYCASCPVSAASRKRAGKPCALR